uniref:ATP synthase complex subunit 8 n=1 Tax=Hypothenemus sp. BMNH 1040235 TaxID=1903787 RepID=A0A343A618_9CUCU|nr:ATP synthase F0 subunit 8 [Hypothenemus sp. BMNH 1040235]
MPQMAPMNWLTLYTLFSLILIITMTISFYQFLYASPSVPKTTKKIKTNWKW